MTPARRRALWVAPVVAVLSVAAACGGDDGAEPAAGTLPGTLSIPATTASTAPASTTSTTAVSVPPTSPAATGAPVIVSVVAEPGADTCTDGTIPAVVRFELAPEPPVRVVTVFLDASQEPAASANAGTTLTIPAVPCDGGVHQVLFIATGTGAEPLSSTQAVAFRAPRSA